MDSWDFEASWSTSLKVISISATLLLVAIPIFMALERDLPPVEMTLLAALPILVLGSTLLFTVRGYSLSGGFLLVRRLLWTTRVDLSGLRSARVDPDAMKGSIRTLGNGGLFSFSGRFTGRRLGPYRALVTDQTSCVVLVTDRGTVVVSPSSPESFAELARSIIHG